MALPTMPRWPVTKIRAFLFMLVRASSRGIDQLTLQGGDGVPQLLEFGLLA
jgi:hypothetical protein